jgi:hypothetical protein
MTTARDDDLEMALRSVVVLALEATWGHADFDIGGESALDDLVRSMGRTTRDFRRDAPLEDEGVLRAMGELERRLKSRLSEITPTTIGRSEVLEVAAAVCPLPPICRGNDV